jgi:hypothetical protein
MFSSPGRGKRFYFLNSVQTGSGAHPPSDPMDTRCSFARIKPVRREADHSFPSGAEMNNDRAIPPLAIHI